MAFWRRDTSANHHPRLSTHQLPPVQRISLPTAERLATITESAKAPPTPPIPRRSSLRISTQRSLPQRWSASATSERTARTAPPAYDWVPDAADNKDDGNAPVEGEKLARLRTDERWRRERRGGRARLLIIVGFVLLLVIALAVGLGVGLRHKSSSKTGSLRPEVSRSQRFPLGSFSLVTTLDTVVTSCTANTATWSCWPFVTYAEDSSTASQATFNWVVANTSATYATADSTPSTPDEGIPANLTVHSTQNPFGIVFDKKPLTYIASALNASSPRYTFSFTMTKTAIPTVALTSDGSASECFFNNTVFSATMYLSAKSDYPSNSSAALSPAGSFEQWPYAVEITQNAAGGTNVPNCYETNDGAIGAPITTGLDAQPATSSCVCAYRNY